MTKHKLILKRKLVNYVATVLIKINISDTISDTITDNEYEIKYNTISSKYRTLYTSVNKEIHRHWIREFNKQRHIY